MKTRVIEIEIAGPVVTDEIMERVMKAVNDIAGNFYSSDNISVEIREQSSRTLPQEPYPMPMNPYPHKPYPPYYSLDPIFYWHCQPSSMAQGKGDCK